MTLSRLANGTSCRFVSLKRPFSNYDFIDSEFRVGQDFISARRIFSQARIHTCQTLVIENIEAAGAVQDENEQLRKLDSKHRSLYLLRLTFWSQEITDESEFEEIDSKALKGYAILKADELPGSGKRVSTVFESVFQKFPHRHNCVPGEAQFSLQCCGFSFGISGVMYCQQNNITKACAQVGLRSLLTMQNPDNDFVYSEIQGAATSAGPHTLPANGLTSAQMRSVMEYYTIPYDDLDYEAAKAGDREKFPYCKFLYSAIESGAAGLLGFDLSGRAINPGEEKHIVPFFGHTFNQDTWVPRAENAYFHVGDDLRYIPSDKWLSSFIGHDDNFGSNFCVPRKYLEPTQVQYILTIRPTGIGYNGTLAETLASAALYSILPIALRSECGSLSWMQRLAHYFMGMDIVFRAVAIARDNYISHLSVLDDWDNFAEDRRIPSTLAGVLPEHLWMVEFSVPDLFSANYRKLGELLFDGSVPANQLSTMNPFVLARLPGTYFIPRDGNEFMLIPSTIQNHTPLFRYNGLPLE
ncbi:MAG: hypothetical protein JXR76_30780 [Deltaproteobacteria bacterium]|nr:hypothetical protein [Deltaproteobacteria bacterium]